MSKQKQITSMKARIKDYIQHEGMSKFLTNIAIGIVVVLGLGNLALSQIHIEVITQLNERLTGLTMFMFVLFGLVSIFLITRMKDRKSGVYRAMGSILITILIGLLFNTYLYQDFVEFDFVTFDTIATSFIFTIILILAYLAAFVLLFIAKFRHDK